MTKKILFCDLDGVVYNFAQAFSKIFKSRIDPSYEIIRDNEGIKDWDWSKWYAKQEHVEKAWDILENTENFWSDLPTLDVEGLWTLNAVKNDLDIYFVTMRSPTLGDSVQIQSYNALRDSGYTKPNVIVTPHKLELISIMKPNFYIDDCPFYFKDPAAFKGMDLVSILDYQYNKDVSKDIPRVKSLSEYVNNILQYI